MVLITTCRGPSKVCDHFSLCRCRLVAWCEDANGLEGGGSRRINWKVVVLPDLGERSDGMQICQNTTGVKDQAARAWGLTNEARGLVGFALGDVGRGVHMTNG